MKNQLEVEVSIDTDEAVKKAERLCEILKEAKTLTDELASAIPLELEFKN
ncbi:MAG: hypothetical protein R3Y58_03410 [Eubacteriales bacterium]